MKTWEVLEYYHVSAEGKVSSTWIVADENGDVLCQAIRHLGYWIYYPIVWRSFEDASKFVMKGMIGELQESLGNLHVGFKNQHIERDGDKQEKLQMPIIQELYAFCAQESADIEGLVAAEIQGVMMPLIGADMQRVESLRSMAKKIMQKTGKKIVLKKFKLVSEEVI